MRHNESRWYLPSLLNKLEINSLGNAESRGEFRQALVKYLEQYKSDLDEDSLRRLESNPLRILDSKVASTQALLIDAPKLKDFIDEVEDSDNDADLLTRS